MEFVFHPEFLLAIFQIIIIDILLGGDNAVVIALACRKLPSKQRTLGILWGTAGAIALRVVLIFFALGLLSVPLLKLVGALVLLWIGIKLLIPEEDDTHDKLESSERLWGAIKTVIVADFVMSLDNVIAIAGAAEGAGSEHRMWLVIFGLLVSIPLIVCGSQLVVKLMDRFPIVITMGGMLLGWIAGGMAVTDPYLVGFTAEHFGVTTTSGPVFYTAVTFGALLVLMGGKLLATKAKNRAVEELEGNSNLI